ncbi:MAG: TetR/AcrR family transcriptional regulator [Candidatus Bipolaricaulota bacterium]|nr:MAG: TetR/AcrR family transcriptional regulator [Candidatus Bipolaricaulota bacterium]
MPKAFAADERERIREQLLAAGRSCFERYGLTKTTVEDLTRPVGIAKSSFYLFFSSKEELYAEIMFEEMPEMMRRLAEASYERTEDVREALVLLMHAIVREIETNPFSKAMLDRPEEFVRLARSVDVERLLQRGAALFAPLAAWIEDRQRRGEIVDGDPQDLVYALGLIKLLPLNRDRVPEPLYRRMLALIPRILAEGLTCPTQEATR